MSDASNQLDPATHNTLVVKSFMSHTTKLDPPRPHPTDPLFAPCSRFAPAGLPLPNIALSSSSIRYSFLMNSDGPLGAPAPPSLFAPLVPSFDCVAESGIDDRPPAAAGPAADDAILDVGGRADRSCETRSSSLTRVPVSGRPVCGMGADVGWTDDQPIAPERDPGPADTGVCAGDCLGG